MRVTTTKYLPEHLQCDDAPTQISRADIEAGPNLFSYQDPRSICDFYRQARVDWKICWYKDVSDKLHKDLRDTGTEVKLGKNMITVGAPMSKEDMKKYKPERIFYVFTSNPRCHNCSVEFDVVKVKQYLDEDDCRIFELIGSAFKEIYEIDIKDKTTYAA